MTPTEAALEYYKIRGKTPTVGEVMAFEHACAWQREQDARVADGAEKRHLAMEDPTSAAVCGQVAAMIREDAKQDSGGPND